MFVESEIQEALSNIGLQTKGKLRVLLVGIANEDGLRHEICIEPEDGPLVANDLRSIETRTGELFEADPISRVCYSHAEVGEERKSALFLRSRANAIVEAIQESGKFEGLSFFASYCAPIEGYDVHTCVGIPSEAIESVPRFNNPIKDDFHGRHIKQSFVDTLIDTCLAGADRALYLPAPGAAPGILGDRVDIVRGSAERFVRGVTFALTPRPSELFTLANDFSSQTYERSGAKGQLVVTQRENLTNKLKVTFKSPVRLREARSVRKILELTDESNVLLGDASSVYGLGECKSAPDVAKITIEEHAKWSLSIDDTALLRVTYGHATLPKQIIDKDRFRDVAERTVGEVEVDRIWDVFQCALENDHGTTIVVSKEPVSEINRLAQGALPIKTEYLDHRDVACLGRVDGAIVLGPDGRCYAFGVILDGLATSSGDRGRGARFNSSVRYHKTSQIGTMIIVISDDGTVDLIPSLRPRVWRQTIDDAVQAFCEYSEIEDKDSEEWARRDEEVVNLSFYLNQEQCDKVNESYEKEMDARLKSGGTSFTRKRLEPDPEMDESYFWDNWSVRD